MRRGISIVAAAGLLAGALLAPAQAQVAGAVPGCSTKAQKNDGDFTVTLHAPGHHPSNWKRVYLRDEKKTDWAALWPIRVTGRHNGKPFSGGHVTYQFLFSGQVVACRTVVKPYVPRFKQGTFHDRIEWPEKSAGFPLTFRVVVKTRWGTRNLDYAVTVKRRPRH